MLSSLIRRDRDGTCPSLGVDLLYEDISNVWSCSSHTLTMRQSAMHLPRMAEQANGKHLGFEHMVMSLN